jgi:hypothetical protein
MPLPGFGPTIPVHKRSKAKHSLDHSATETGPSSLYTLYIARRWHVLTQYCCPLRNICDIFVV